MSIIIFQSHPIQYFSPLYKEMAQSFEMEVVYYSDTSIKPTLDKGFGKKIQWDIPLLEGYQYSFLKNFSPSKSMDCKWYNAINISVFKKVKKTTANVLLINGWSYFSDWMVIFSAKLFKKEIWVRADNPLSQEQRKGFKAVLKKFVLRKFLFPHIDKFLYVGKESKSFFEFYGAKQNKLLYTPHAVDNTFFQQQHSTLEARKSEIKTNLGIPITSKIILWSAKMISKKRPFDILRAFEQLQLINVHLILLGDGVLRTNIENYIALNGIANVHLIGFVNQSFISQYYSIADVFVLTSGFGETWGLVVNEAMNFGLPIIVSNACGSATDLVEDADNGLVYTVGDIESLRIAMQQFISDEQFACSAGEKSLSKIQQFSFQIITKQIKQHLIKSG